MTLRSIQLTCPGARFSLTLRKKGERNTIDVFSRKGGRVASIIKVNSDAPVLPTPPNPVPGSTTIISSELIALYAVSDLGGHRVVVSIGSEQCAYADYNDESHAGKVVGLTIAAASVDTLARINTSGIVDEQSWSWEAGGDIWLVAEGLMTQTPPMEGAFIQRVGYALSPTRIRITLDDPIFL